MHRNEPKSELTRYAFGYSDKKPSWTFWVIIGGMTLVVIAKMWSLVP